MAQSEESQRKLRIAHRLIDAARSVSERKCKAAGHHTSNVEDVEVHLGYAEPGYGTGNDVIATGNWNEIDRYVPETRSRVEIDDTPTRLGAALERHGIEIEWSDEWATCDDCNKLVRTSPDSYGWKQSYVQDEDGIRCHACVLEDPEAYLESLEGNPKTCVTLDVDPTEHGYVLVEGEFERGMHHGQDADPKLVAAALDKAGVTRYLFRLDDVGQFDAEFSVYVHESESETLAANRAEYDDAPKDGPSVSDAMARGLKEASRLTDKLEGEGIRVATVHSDGTATARLVSHAEFVEGIKSK